MCSIEPERRPGTSSSWSLELGFNVEAWSSFDGEGPCWVNRTRQVVDLPVRLGRRLAANSFGNQSQLCLSWRKHTRGLSSCRPCARSHYDLGPRGRGRRSTVPENSVSRSTWRGSTWLPQRLEGEDSEGLRASFLRAWTIVEIDETVSIYESPATSITNGRSMKV